MCVAGLAFPVVVAWWLAYEWRRALFGDPVPLSDDLPSVDLARKVWVSDKFGLLDDEPALQQDG
jgi:hypothetical protein